MLGFAASHLTKQTGFSLIELILVIILLGMMGGGTLRYISLGAQIYAEATQRDEAVAQSRFMLARLSRELRHAAPNSARLSCDNTAGNLCSSSVQCLEFTPFKASSIYVGDVSTTTITLVDATGYPFATANSANDAASIYALAPADIYDASKGKRIVINSAIDNAADSNLDIWTMAGVFAEGSPTKRIFVLAQPVMFCVEGTELFRYENYGFTTIQATPNISHDLGTAKGILMGHFIQNDLLVTPFFNYDDASLTRNSVVNIRSEMGFNDTETLAFNHEIHLPNVP